MAFRTGMARVFYREPRNSKFDWISVGFGTILLALGILGILVDDTRGVLFDVDPEFVLLGSAFVMMGGAELLARDQRQVAALLRVLTIAAYVSFVAVLLLTF